MITSHPAIHTCQNYDYFSRIPRGLPVIIAVSCRCERRIAWEPTEARLTAYPAAARGGMSPNDTNCDRVRTMPSEKPGGSRRRPKLVCQDWSSSSSMKDGSSSSTCLALLRKSIVSAMISQP